MLAVAAVVLSMALVSASESDAQTRRPRVSIPVPAQTPPPNEPLIISRAEDFPDENAEAVPPQPVTGTSDQGGPSRLAIEELGSRVKQLESDRKDNTDAKQRRLLLNLDILTRSEQRAETLRKQLFEMIERESAIRTKLEQIDNDIRPEAIDRQIAFAGTLRPEELRESRRKSLEAEKTNLQTLLTEVTRTKNNLDLNVQKADALVDRLREKLEKEIDSALADDPVPSDQQ